MEWIKSIAWTAVLLVVAVLLFLQPSRILYPRMAGVVCPEATLCTDRPDRLEEARELRRRALDDIEVQLGALEQPPKMVFCDSSSCFASFGFADAAGHSIGAFGIVIGPEGWEPHYVRHELIHHWQAEKLGAIGRWRAPTWLIEGMAYDLSGDPREQLGVPIQGYRERFRRWYRIRFGDDLVLAIKRELWGNGRDGLRIVRAR